MSGILGEGRRRAHSCVPPRAQGLPLAQDPGHTFPCLWPALHSLCSGSLLPPCSLPQEPAWPPSPLPPSAKAQAALIPRALPLSDLCIAFFSICKT